jgi:pyruvate/2-oxoglutarate dehydrogenase complex dihydrolipoamide acyltransferase (E2) component
LTSQRVEDIHTGAMFAPGEEAVGLDPDNDYDAAKIADGAFEPIPPDAEEAGPDATPEAVEKAAELGVDLSQVTGTGENGRIKVGDVEKAHEAEEAK